MVEPVSALKAEFFKTMAHPARVRILELLVCGDRTVTELLPVVGIEASNLSQHLGVLRRAGVVLAHRRANVMTYSIASPHIAELLAVSRTVLSGLLNDQVGALHPSAAQP